MKESNVMYGYIYKTTNLENNKIYIGQKKSSRFLSDRYLGSGKHLKKAVQKYGKERFFVELIEEVQDESLMDEREIYWISFYDSTNPNIGYNISSGGNVNRTMVGIHNPRYGKHLTDAEKSKQRLAIEKRIANGYKRPSVSQETRNKLCQANLGHTVSQATREKLRYYNTHKIPITNGEINKTILPEFFADWEKKGFYIGRVKKSYPKKVWVNNGKIQTLILLEDLPSYETQGFARGKIKIPGRKAWNSGKTKETDIRCSKCGKSMKGKENPMYGVTYKWMNNGFVNKRISLNDVEAYSQKGYKVGMIKNKVIQ